MSKKSKKSTERLIKELVRKQMYEDSISEEPEHRSIMPSKRTRSHIHNSAKDFWDDFDKSFDDDEKDIKSNDNIEPEFSKCQSFQEFVGRNIADIDRQQTLEDAEYDKKIAEITASLKNATKDAEPEDKTFFDKINDEKDMPHLFTARTLNVKTGESKSLWNTAKTYVLDTNILLQSPDSIFGFDDNEVVVTGTTLQELDSKKTAPGELGYNARRAIKNIYKIIEHAVDPTKDTKMDNGGFFRIETDRVADNLPVGYSNNVPDNRIISATLELTKDNPETFLITNDVSMRIAAKTCGVKAQEYRNDQVDTDKIYTGRRVIEGEFAQNMDAPKDMELNEFALMKSGNKSALCMNNGGVMELIKDADVETSLCKPRNSAQRFAMRALLAPADEISLCILKGPAGSAKTYLSLAAGLNDTYCMQTKKGYKGKYDKIVITRTNSISDADIGFLPGSLEDKMSPLIAPFTDNLATLLNVKEDDMEQVNMQIQDMFDAGIIEIVSMAYMRGRSLNNAFVIIDEAQNATRSQITTIATRMGLGSKLVVLGDPDQVDNPKLDRRNNGLAYISEKMKGYAGCAQLTFTDEEIVRSDLAMEAARRLAK